MSVLDALDLLELLGLFTGFWAFIFSPRYRRSKLREWQTRGLLGRLIIPIEATLATVFGTMPFWLGYLLIHG